MSNVGPAGGPSGHYDRHEIRRLQTPIRDCAHEVAAFRQILAHGGPWSSSTDPGLCIADDGRLVLVRRPEVHPVTALILGASFRPMRVIELYATDGPVLHEPSLLEIDALEMRREYELKQRARRRDEERPKEPPHATA